MMQCRNCGATIHEGEAFCRTCGTTVTDQTVFKNDSANVAMNGFVSQQQIPNSTPSISYEETIVKTVEPKVSAEDNKKFVKRDGNDRAKATLMNFISLAALIILLVILAIFLYNTVFQSLF